MGKQSSFKDSANGTILKIGSLCAASEESTLKQLKVNIYSYSVYERKREEGR